MLKKSPKLQRAKYVEYERGEVLSLNFDTKTVA